MKRLIFAALMAGTTLAHAEFKDGNQLLEQLTGSAAEKMNAMGYITGVADAIDGVGYCAPGNIRVGQITDMVQNYLQRQPAVRHFSGDLIVRRVLVDMWPCEKKKGNAL